MGAGHCRSAVRLNARARLSRVAFVSAFAGSLLPLLAAPAGAVTSTTLPGPAPNQSQINATQAQVAQIESTLTQEEQQTSILDDRYNTAEQNLQNAQASLKSLNANVTRTRS